MNCFEPGSLRRDLSRWLLALVASLALATAAHATSVQSRNLVQLIDESDSIIVGAVEDLSDGIDARGVPYTEVTVRVSERIRGKQDGETYTFRQFGLMKPRQLQDGRTLLAVTPQGWPNYAQSEEVMLFLHKPARITGLQTTVGLNQGKLRIANNRARSGADNVGLFDGVKVTPGLLKKEEQALLSNRKGPVDAEPLLSLVRRAVDERWVETGRMKNER